MTTLLTYASQGYFWIAFGVVSALVIGVAILFEDRQ